MMAVARDTQHKTKQYAILPICDVVRQLTSGHTKNFYELIHETNLCKVYLDVDCRGATNKENKVKILRKIKRTISRISAALRAIYPVVLRHEDVVVLSAHDPGRKISFHVRLGYRCANTDVPVGVRGVRQIKLLIRRACVDERIVDPQVYGQPTQQIRTVFSSKFYDHPGGRPRPLRFSSHARLGWPLQRLIDATWCVIRDPSAIAIEIPPPEGETARRRRTTSQQHTSSPAFKRDRTHVFIPRFPRKPVSDFEVWLAEKRRLAAEPRHTPSHG